MVTEEVDHAQIESMELDWSLDNPDNSEEVTWAHTEGMEINL